MCRLKKGSIRVKHLGVPTSTKSTAPQGSRQNVQPGRHQQPDDESLGLLAEAGEHGLLERYVGAAHVERRGTVVLASERRHACQAETHATRQP